ncbi:MAG: ABC transporter ATP-binding protein [Chitinophagaceae bacterium]
MPGIIVSGITKKYGNLTALDGVSLEVNPGELFGLIGPDGAGKTTLFRILTTLLLADQGHGSVEGLDLVKDYRKIRTQMGYMPGRFSLYQDLSVQENLEFFATIFSTTLASQYENIREIYDRLAPFKDRRAGELSGGMKQKLALCCALIHQPRVLFLDEPTTGVDAVSRVEFWELLGRLRQRGITILVSTPYMDEAILCDRVALIQQGKILGVQTPAAIISAYGSPLYQVIADDPYPLLQQIRPQSFSASCYLFGDSLHLTLSKVPDAQQKWEAFCRDYPGSPLKSTPIAAGIEDCFIQLMKPPSA